MPKRAGPGRPLSTCATERCRLVVERNRKRERCARCADRIATHAERMAALCRPCQGEVVRMAAPSSGE
ncbi:MAG: hypothetical protein EOO71_20745 [Myxococcaceae bacterium]|nr:MAG: hypothetical protein EOO71_20745 [Myxococcaceae bacterium]